MTAIYNYTEQDLLVWQKLYHNIKPVHQSYACSAYLQGIEELCFNANDIPTLENINEVLFCKNGWQAIESKGLLDNKTFFQLLAKKQFPVTTWIRPIERMYDYDDADFFHDGLGHLPMLLNPNYSNFLEGISKLERRYPTTALEYLARLYWRTIEMGLVKEDDTLKIYGAALLSSGGESAHSVSLYAKRKPFKMYDVMNEPYRYDCVQEHYYVLDSLEKLELTLIDADFRLQLLTSVWAS
jgi:phenylalanine-4-hydroxylase